MYTFPVQTGGIFYFARFKPRPWARAEALAQDHPVASPMPMALTRSATMPPLEPRGLIILGIIPRYHYAPSIIPY